MSIILATDGAAKNHHHPKKRRAGVGFVVERNGTIIHEESQPLGTGKYYTNNVAEYEALITGLSWVRDNVDLDEREIDIVSDSELLIKQLIGEWDVKDTELSKKHTEITEMTSQMDNVTFERRSECDSELINKADTLATEGSGDTEKPDS